MLRMDAICLASVLMGIVAVLYIGQLFVQVKQEMKKVGWLLCVSVASFFTIQISSEIYMDMTGEEQQAVIAQFGSTEDFMVWFNAVKAIYEAEHPNIEVGGDSTVDGSQIGKK